MTQEWTQADVDDYLQRIHDSGVFEAGTQRSRLLKYLLETECAGNGETLKAYTVGIDALDRPDSFDPARDSGVRVAMGRLRGAIELFEGTSFADARISVEIPVGSYRPNVTIREVGPSDLGTQDPDHMSSQTKGIIAFAVMAGIAFLAFASLTFFGPISGPQDSAVAIEVDAFRGDEALAEDVASTLRRALSRNQAVRVVSDTDPDRLMDETDFVISGKSERIQDDDIRISVELTSVAANEIVWAKSLQLNESDPLADRVMQVFGNELRVRIFGASKAYLAARDPETLTPEQLFIMATWVPGPAMNAVDWELDRVALMGLALQKDPEFGAAHSVMADKLAYLANVYGPSNTIENRTAALYHAQRARELAPLNPDVMFNVAQALWHSGEITQSHGAMRRVIELDPSHDLARFLSQVIPYSCRTPTPDVIEWAVDFDRALSPDNPIRWLTLTWIAWLYTNAGEYQTALGYEEQAALVFEIPYTFMRHAMLLNILGRTEEAVAIIQSQQENWPDIDPTHFADITWPRLCSEDEDVPGLVSLYRDLAKNTVGDL